MENPPASERPAADRSDDVRDSVRNGIRLDGERKHQRLREGTPGCKPVGAGRFSFKVSPSSLQVHDDRITYLAGRRR
jgi:hypothetical protein